MPKLSVGAAFVPCSGVLSRVESGYLDCVSDDLALLLAARGVNDVRAPFAMDWRFDAIEQPGALPRLDLPPADQDNLLARRTGWRPHWRPVTSVWRELPNWYRALAGGGPVVLVGDAFGLPWSPYHQREHMDHGFVLDGLEPGGHRHGYLAHVVDPYDNPTQWGRATPLVTRLPVDSFADALAGGRWGVLEPAGAADPVDPVSVVRSNAAAIVAAARRGAYHAFADCHRPAGPAELENLTLQSWLLTRNRLLHARWLADLPPRAVDPDLANRFGTLIGGGWQRVRELSYIALRRIRSGRPAPTAVLPVLQAVLDDEVRLAHDLLDGPGPGAFAGPGSALDTTAELSGSRRGSDVP